MKKIIVHRILVSMTLILSFFLLYFYLGIVLMPKDANDTGASSLFAAKAIFEEDKNTIDAIFMGNSDVYSGISPLDIYKTSGFTSFDCAYPRESIHSIKEQLKKTLKRQTPKLVVIDVDCLFDGNSSFHGSQFYNSIYLYSVVKYHTRWKELQFKDFYTLPKQTKSDLKGYKLDDTIIEYTKPNDYMQKITDDKAPLKKSVKRDLRDIINICKKNNINLEFICLPTPISWNEEKYNAVNEYAKEYNIDFMDFNLPSSPVDIDYSHDFRDAGNHMNKYGAKKMSTFLANHYATKYNFDDHRTQNDRKDWDALIKKYKDKL